MLLLKRGANDTKNDVVALLDTDGNIVVQYVYDAWGNHRVLDKDGNEITEFDHIGHQNPFRYRGYFYETVSGLYYLKSRYYDPETGRFLTPDSVEYLDPETIGGLNLYAYCNNNPVMFSDPEGHDWKSFWNGALKIISGIGSVLVGVTKFISTGNAVLSTQMALQTWMAHDIYQLASGQVFAYVSEKGDIEIKNSANLVSPIVQTAYVFYLNHFNPNTKNIIKGTTSGAQGELLAHNLAYYALSVASWSTNLFGGDASVWENYKDFANPANIGGTVFDNGDNWIAKGMVAFNILTRPIATLIDFLTWKI